jgi:hypothetical protein
VDVRVSVSRPEIEKVDMPPSYMSDDYYFVRPPLLCRLFQVWFLWGLAAEYETRRVHHIF